MPNIVHNTITIQTNNVRKILNDVTLDGSINFQKLIPMPMNHWHGEETPFTKGHFPNSFVKDARRHWGSDSNTIHDEITVLPDGIIKMSFIVKGFTPPRGWVCAIFNTHHVNIEHLYTTTVDGKSFIEYYKWENEKPTWRKEICNENRTGNYPLSES